MTLETTGYSESVRSISLLMLFVLGAVGALTPLAIDMYLPAMPAIANDLASSSGAVQTTLTVYIVGYAFGQLLYGPLSDSYGRCPIAMAADLYYW